MKGDYSRLRFRPRDRYSGVRMQQGRVHLDAEWNEQVDIEAHRDEMTALDVIGPQGVPYVRGGFEITAGAGLNGVHFPATGAGWAVGEEATLVESTDQGLTFGPPVAPPTGVTASLNAVHLVAAGDGWAVGDAGTVLRLAPGSTWTQVPLGAAAGALLGLHFTAADEGWVVGERATLVRRSGTSWTPQTPQEVTGALRDVAALSAKRAFAVGDGGAIVATSDGSTWARQVVDVEIGTLHAVTSMVAGGVERAWAVGEGGVIVALGTDGQWKQVTTPRDFSATLRGIAFVSADNGFAVGDEGLVLKTTNGGANWSRQSMPAEFASDLRALTLAGSVPVAVGDHTVVRPGQSSVFGKLASAARSLTISAGDAYVHGVRCVNERTVTYSRQPDYPGARLPVPSGGGEAIYGAYLRRAEHHMTAVEREQLREPALGGPDTTTRTKTVWQVRLIELTEGTCAALEAAIEPPPAAERALLRARSTPSMQSSSECIVAPGGGYKRLENQLYRVEVLDQEKAEDGGTVTAFTWSRENGSVAARMLEIDADDLAVTFDELDRDQALTFGPEDWIELTDEGRALRGERGLVAEVKTVRGNIIEVEEWPGGATPSMNNFPHTPIVRRWEGKHTLETGKWIELEDGVEVEFSTGAVEPGDFWAIPARSLLGDVEWQRNGSTPVFELGAERGVRNAPLAIVKRHSGGTWERLGDCRRRFPPLTGLVQLYYVGGDGQEVMPDLTVSSDQRLKLDQPLEVGVSNWRWPVEGASVQFERVVGGGSLGGPTNAKLVVVTDEDGIARCDWYLDGTTQSQTVEATLLDEDGSPVQTPIRFNASLSRATHVAYDPSDCQNLLEAGAKTVQAAVSRLAGQPRLIEVGGDAQETLPGETLDEIQVRVENSCGPLEGAKVRFTVVGGDGTLSGGSGTPHAVDLATDANGKAGAAWTLGPDAATQYVEAQLLDDGTGATLMPPPPVVMFSANLSRAEHVAYTPPERCRGLDATTVQEALDELCVPPFGAFAHLDGHGAGTLMESHNVASFSKAGAEPGRYSFVWERPLSRTAPLLVFAYARAWPGGRFPLLAAIAERKQTGLTVQVSRTSDYYASTAPADGFVALAVLGGIPDTLPPEPAPPIIVKATQSLPIGSWITDFATADLDRSGLPDLIVAAGNGIHAFVNRGDGQFDEAGIVGTANVSRLAVADVNGDGIPDLVCATYSNSVTIYYGAGNGTFGDPFTVDVGANVYSLSVGALTGPGRADIATLGGDGKVRILATNVDGNFEVVRELETGVSSYNGDVLAAGVGDNLADVLVTYPGANKVAVFRRRANLEFTDPDLIDVADGPNRLGAGDLTGNGALDFVVLCQNDLAVLLSGPRGRLSEPARYFAGYFPNSIAIADVGDGNPDLIVGSHEVVGVLPATAPGKFRDPVPVFTPFGTGPQRVVAADFNGDGRMDIAAVADGTNMLNILTSE